MRAQPSIPSVPKFTVPPRNSELSRRFTNSSPYCPYPPSSVCSSACHDRRRRSAEANYAKFSSGQISRSAWDVRKFGDTEARRKRTVGANDRGLEGEDSRRSPWCRLLLEENETIATPRRGRGGIDQDGVKSREGKFPLITMPRSLAIEAWTRDTD